MSAAVQEPFEPEEPKQMPKLVLHQSTVPTARERLEDAIGAELAQRLVAALASRLIRRLEPAR